MINTKISGKTVLITGANSGIGKACVYVFANQGANVIIHYLDEKPKGNQRFAHTVKGREAATTILKELESKGQSAMCISGNLFDTKIVEKLFNESEKVFGSVDILINNAAHCEFDTTLNTSKAAIESYTRSIANEVGKYGINVNCISPGPVQTGYITKELEEQVLPDIPLRRIGSPTDISDAVIFLSSEQSKWITGVILKVSGGHNI